MCKMAGCCGGFPGGKGSLSLYPGLQRQKVEVEGRESGPNPDSRDTALPCPLSTCPHFITRTPLALIHPELTFKLETLHWYSALFPFLSQPVFLADKQDKKTHQSFTPHPPISSLIFQFLSPSSTILIHLSKAKNKHQSLRNPLPHLAPSFATASYFPQNKLLTSLAKTTHCCLPPPHSLALLSCRS